MWKVRFHEVMREVEAKLNYRKDSLLVGLRKATLKELLLVGGVLEEEFGVKPELIAITYHDSHIALTVPLSGTKQEVVEKDGKEEVEETGGTEGEQHFVKLTDKVGYRVESGELVLVYENNGSRQNLFRVDMQKVYDLYDELPEKVDKGAILDALDRLKIRVPAIHVHYLMQFLASYPVFSAEIVREGNRKYLVKRDGRVMEMRDKLAVEREVIGAPWEAR